MIKKIVFIIALIIIGLVYFGKTHILEDAADKARDQVEDLTDAAKSKVMDKIDEM